MNLSNYYINDENLSLLGVHTEEFEYFLLVLQSSLVTALTVFLGKILIRILGTEKSHDLCVGVAVAVKLNKLGNSACANCKNGLEFLHHIYVVNTLKGDRMMPAVDEFVDHVDIDKGVYVRVIPGMLEDEE